MALLTPYVIDGAKHSARVFRRQLQYAVGDGSGVARPADFRVTATPTPGRGVRIAQGGVLVQSRDAGATRETYGIENDAALDFFGPEGSEGIPGTGSGGGRRDLIIVEVMDPKMASVTYPVPSDPEVGPWSRIRVVSGVGSSVRRVDQVASLANVTAYAIAAINWPANTATITNAMIQDLREVQVPRRDEVVFARPRVAADNSAQNWLTTTVANGGEYFPGGGGYSNEFQAEIPSWATRIIIDADWMSVRYASGKNANGRFWVEFGDEFRNKTWPNKQQWEFATQQFMFDATGTTGVQRTNWRLMNQLTVPAKLRGKTVTFVFKAGLAAGAPTDGASMDSLSGLGMRLTFVETALGIDDAI